MKIWSNAMKDMARYHDCQAEGCGLDRTERAEYRAMRALAKAEAVADGDHSYEVKVDILDKYFHSLKAIWPATIVESSGAERRPGTQFVREVKVGHVDFRPFTVTQLPGDPAAYGPIEAVADDTDSRRSTMAVTKQVLADMVQEDQQEVYEFLHKLGLRIYRE